ncbi:protease complex subunit PrcB family protein [Gilvimarinus xylanilyticus]|uniref:Protease complex subunit PrcB family protein n=1 Tax=Gilvimarinus xylanilyticus TaxID=2944139 RepID=A0A9X2I3F9_9GAMM|nr:protease complex subunit PrcB family protein [Gilvimarinus xylanilyticus]MCP8899301.1 protease complex subunit PrcB family protein [Gilvimarinus xylanilyticus]
MSRKRSLYNFLIGGLLLALLVGCGSGSDESPEVNFTRLDCPAVASHTSYTEPYFDVLTDPHAYRERYLATDLNAQDEAPEVNFETHRVVVLHAGVKSSSGHSIDVINIEDRGEKLQVNYREGEPQTCGADGALTYPYCFIAIEASDTPVEFSGEVVNSCD